MHFISFMKVMVGVVGIVFPTECDEFDKMVIESAGTQMYATTLPSAVFNPIDKCFSHPFYYQPSDAE